MHINLTEKQIKYILNALKNVEFYDMQDYLESEAIQESIKTQVSSDKT
jgi:hypothetical protein